MRYSLVRDESGHWYLVPVDLRDEFDRSAALEIEPPEGAIRLYGSPSAITFENPEGQP